jgi:hypothetical protein
MGARKWRRYVPQHSPNVFLDAFLRGETGL